MRAAPWAKLMTKTDSSEVRFRILRLLDADPTLSQRDLARVLGISLGRVNYCLRALAEKGDIKVRNFRAFDHKLRYVYALTPKGIKAKARLTVQFLKYKLMEYEALAEEIAQLRDDAARVDTLAGEDCNG